MNTKFYCFQKFKDTKTLTVLKVLSSRIMNNFLLETDMSNNPR